MQAKRIKSVSLMRFAEYRFIDSPRVVRAELELKRCKQKSAPLVAFAKKILISIK